MLAEYNLPFVKVGGYFVAYKSGEIDEELEKSKKAILILEGRLRKLTNSNCLKRILRGHLYI